MSSTISQDTVQRSSTTRSSPVTTEHSVSKVPGMHSSSCRRTADLALARQQHVEESGFLPARLGNAEHLLRLRSDVGEAALREVQLERNGARGLGDQPVLFAAALELARALVDMSLPMASLVSCSVAACRREFLDRSSGSAGPRTAASRNSHTTQTPWSNTRHQADGADHVRIGQHQRCAGTG